MLSERLRFGGEYCRSVHAQNLKLILLVILVLQSEGHYCVPDRSKEPTRLSQQTVTNCLTPESLDYKAIPCYIQFNALTYFQRLIRNYLRASFRQS